LTDGIVILNFLFLGGSPPDCLDAADTDDQGDLNLKDPVLLFNFLFLGGKEPPDPGPFECGVDPPAGGSVSCTSFAPCGT